ncbi:MAG: DUF885 domain-containing protein [Gemmatimonadota bacterium]|nr:MAG: DUF885 domain-containing protein [Gemmatimonadota bacterium]
MRVHSLRRAPAILSCLALLSFTADGRAQVDGWVERSNENAQILLDIFARFAPEGAGQLGVSGLDEEILDLAPRITERANEAVREAVRTLQARLAEEEHPLVRQDLEILIQSAEQAIEAAEFTLKYDLPYFNLAQTVFQGVRSLLDDQVEASRRPAALVRLRKYAGLEARHTPIARLARDRIEERLGDPELSAPFKEQIEQDLQNAPTFLAGIGSLFQHYGVEGYEDAYNALQTQLEEYHAFVRAEVIPRARSDFRIPEDRYAFTLRQFGVDIPVAELISRAQVSFREIQNEMQALAPLVAKERGFAATDYRDVIRELKKEQLVGEAILPHYEQRIKDMEEIISRERVVTLPERDMRMRLATEAESAALPAPNLRPPRLIGNTGEMGEFVLPLRIPDESGELIGMDDFTLEAASWTLTAHEGRPGHELQFASMVEAGLSTARAIFAFNSVNVEGWALYAEAEMKPYLPLDGQLISLQSRLARAARAILDPGLQLGMVTREEAFRLLEQDVVLSHAMALQEVQRYTFRLPGQATAYFYGYTRLMELRAEVERILGPSFDRQRFNDFILAQGLLPPALLRKTVLEQFVPQERERA